MWSMDGKLYSGLKKLWEDLYSGIGRERKYHSDGWMEVQEELFENYETGKNFYKEHAKRIASFIKKTNSKAKENVGKIVAVPSGVGALFAGYRGFSDVIGYDCNLPILENMDTGDCRSYFFSLVALTIGAVYHDMKMSRSREGKIRIQKERELLIGELNEAREQQSKEYIKGMKDAGENTKRMRDELRILRERIANQDKEMARLKEDSEFQVKALKELLKEKRKRDKEKQNEG
jgi:hypothetical protein